MPIGSDFADDLKNEVLTEMADNFFSRRCRLDERLENFESLRQRVIRRAAPAVDAVQALRRLLLSSPAADAFFKNLDLDPAALPPAGQTLPIPRPLALTAGGRYRKAVLRAYDTMRKAIEHYNEGGYAPDPRQPGRMMPTPGYNHLQSVAESINAEIEAVNATQSPSDLIRFNRSLDPGRLDQESACGCIGDMCRLNNELAFTPLDPATFGVPRLPTPPPAQDMQEQLAQLADTVRQTNPQAADAALG
jgi:hypothetical protein